MIGLKAGWEYDRTGREFWSIVIGGAFVAGPSNVFAKFIILPEGCDSILRNEKHIFMCNSEVVFDARVCWGVASSLRNKYDLRTRKNDAEGET